MTYCLWRRVFAPNACTLFPSGLFLFLLMTSTSAVSHELRPAIADLTFSANRLDVSMLVNLEALMAEIGPEHDDTDDSPNTDHYTRLRGLDPEMLKAEFEGYLPTLLSGIRIADSLGDALLARVEFQAVSIPETGDTRLPRDSVLNLRIALNESLTAISWLWDARYGPLILRVSESNGETPFSQYLQAGQQSDTIAIVDRVPRSAWTVFGDYIVIGFEHIIPKGIDHILFVMGLFLLSPRWKPITWQVTVFTLAHTITLALSTYQLISIPASIVEPLIALSITVVCVENVFRTSFGAGRSLVVLLFGLLHGLGFASVLGEAGLSQERFLSSLLGFNLGVELGQLAVIFLCFVLVGWWFRNKSGYRKWFSIPASAAIGAVGVYWFVTRIAG